MDVKNSKLAEVVQEMQKAIQRPQTTAQKGRVASSDEFDILKVALNLQVKTAPAMNHALLEKKQSFFMHRAIIGITHMGMTFPMPEDRAMISRQRRSQMFHVHPMETLNQQEVRIEKRSSTGSLIT